MITMTNKNITHKKYIFEQKELKFIFKWLKESELLPCEDIHIYYWPKTDVFRMDFFKGEKIQTIDYSSYTDLDMTKLKEQLVEYFVDGNYERLDHAKTKD